MIFYTPKSFYLIYKTERSNPAIYHLSIKIITRTAGCSAVAAAAYRAGDIIKNERNGTIHDYTRKSDVSYTEILLPDNAPPEYKNRATLWNAVEQVEKASNGQLAKKIPIALPVELTLAPNKSPVREYVKKNFTDLRAVKRIYRQRKK